MIVKKIVLIGSDHKAALELIYKKLLEQNGYICSIFPAQTLFLEYYNLSLSNKIFYRLGLSTIIDSIQKKLKKFISFENPSVVIVFKGMEVKPSTIRSIKNGGITIINYNPDHPFIFSGNGSGNSNVTKSITLFDYYFSYAEDAVRQLEKLGVKSCKIPFGFDEDSIHFNELDSVDEVLRACFVGNGDKFRVEFINHLANLGLRIDVYGENWHRFKLAPSIKVGPPKYGIEFWKTLQKYAVQLNLLRPHNYNTHNMRSFDIPGAGGIMLAPFSNDHKIYFDEGIEVFLFENVEMAFQKAKLILNLSFDERRRIRKLARERALKYHTYQARVNQLVSFL